MKVGGHYYILLPINAKRTVTWTCVQDGVREDSENTFVRILSTDMIKCSPY